MSQWDYKIDQPIPGPFPFPNSRKGPGIEVVPAPKRYSRNISVVEIRLLFSYIIDIRKGNGLATLFNTIHDLRFSC